MPTNSGQHYVASGVVSDELTPRYFSPFFTRLACSTRGSVPVQLSCGLCTQGFQRGDSLLSGHARPMGPP